MLKKLKSKRLRILIKEKLKFLRLDKLQGKTKVVLQTGI